MTTWALECRSSIKDSEALVGELGLNHHLEKNVKMCRDDEALVEEEEEEEANLNWFSSLIPFLLRQWI